MLIGLATIRKNFGVQENFMCCSTVIQVGYYIILSPLKKLKIRYFL